MLNPVPVKGLTSMSALFLLAIMVVPRAMAFPGMAGVPGVRSASEVEAQLAKRQTTCPFNAKHVPAPPITSQFPYAGAQNGLPSTRPGNFQVPAFGDNVHGFVPPGPNDIRGPCPGLNTAANHNFISHDGVTTFTELVNAQQNIYNVGYDLAVLLAVLGVELDGDPVTQKMSIGCDATSRTSSTGSLLGAEGGLDSHNARDASLTRADFFFGDDHSYNNTYFTQLTALAYNGGPKTGVATSYSYNQSVLAQHQYNRYQNSKATNPNFFFGPKAILLYGAASFLYELFPSHGIDGSPNFVAIGSFYGVTNPDVNGKVRFNNTEHIPSNPAVPKGPQWNSTTNAYTIPLLLDQVIALYSAHPVLFGGNVGVGNFDALGFGTAIQNGKLSLNKQDLLCLLYQLATDDVPDSVSSVLTLPSQLLGFATAKLNPIFANSGCTLKSPT